MLLKFLNKIAQALQDLFNPRSPAIDAIEAEIRALEFLLEQREKKRQADLVIAADIPPAEDMLK